MTSTPTSNTSDVGGGHEPPNKTSVLRHIVQLVALCAVFASVFVAATTGPSAADWREECIGEGCSGGEKEELFESFQSECVYEDCWAEEVGEIAGVGLHPNGSLSGGYLVREMMNDFQSRSSYDVLEVEIRSGRTDTFGTNLWRGILELLDGRDVGLTCDFDAGSGYVGDCRP